MENRQSIDSQKGLTMYDWKRNNYARKVLNFVEENLSPSEQVTEVEIQHDLWCDLLNRRGHCNCDPAIWMRSKRED